MVGSGLGVRMMSCTTVAGDETQQLTGELLLHISVIKTKWLKLLLKELVPFYPSVNCQISS